MALQVWLPLTDGTLKQQGLKNVSATVGGTVGLTDAGKLGKCATFSTTGSGITLPASAMTSFTECSVAFWINITAWNTSWDTIFQAGLSSTPWNNYIFGILRNQHDYLCFTISNGSTSSSGSYYSSNLTTGVWTHLAFTYETGKCKIYINGVLDKEYTTSIIPKFSDITNIAIGRSTNGSNYQSNCKLNDFRIYDHCLSPMEVKYIAQGLVLHYPLNRNGWGQENYILDSHKVTSGGNANGITRTYESDDSVKIVSTSGNGNYASIGFARNSNDIVGANFSVGDTYTISCDIKVTSGTVLPTLFINSGNSYKQLRGTIITGQWIRAYYTSTWAEPGTSYGNIQLHLGFSSAIGTYYFKNFKLEKGSVVTPWCPNSSDALATTMGLNGTTEYDCSGFCNNGTRTGTFNWTSDTPKYAVSTKFTGTQYITGASPTTNGATLAAWVKTTSTNNQALVIDYKSGLGMGFWSSYIICSCNSSVKTTFPVSAYAVNQWNHIVVVKESATTLSCYINGVKQTAGSTQDYWTTGVIDGFSIAARPNGASPVSCQVSDVRIYATALSAADVKSLYQNCATIDPDGTIRGQIRS